MHTRTIVLFVVLFVAIVAGMFIFAYLKRGEIAVPPTPPPQVDAASATGTPYVTRVDAKHYYIDGVHTVAGVIDMPTPCDLLEATATVGESNPEQIVIHFSVINNDESCPQRITAQRFKVSATAAKEAVISATWEGIPIDLNLIPAAAGEKPEDFELFIKG